jgi:hypothetical protein
LSKAAVTVESTPPDIAATTREPGLKAQARRTAASADSISESWATAMEVRGQGWSALHVAIGERDAKGDAAKPRSPRVASRPGERKWKDYLQ